jgi:hypothetical protein
MNKRNFVELQILGVELTNVDTLELLKPEPSLPNW